MRRSDPLGLKRALANRLLPALVAAMAFLSALALAGAIATASLSDRWGGEAAGTMMVQVPPGIDVQAAMRRISAMPAVAAAVPLDPRRLSELLQPLLGNAENLPLPALIELRLQNPDRADELPALIQSAIPGAIVEAHGLWVGHLLALVRSIQRLAWFVLAIVMAVSVIIIIIATRSGLVACRPAIIILHNMGATDRMIAGPFSARLAWLSALGAFGGTAAAVPILMLLGSIAAPILQLPVIPPWMGLVIMPPAAALIAWITVQITVRLWLRALP